jgi:hypothetical protein
MWDCLLTPASGCFTPNCNSETNTSQGKAEYTILSIIFNYAWIFFEYQYEGVSKSFQTGCLEQELQMVQLFAIRCSCITILWVSVVSFATITLCVASQWVFVAVVIVVYFFVDSVQKLLDTPSYTVLHNKGKGVWVLWKGEETRWNVFRRFCLISAFCGPPKKEQTIALRKLYMCHRNVNNQTNPLQVDNLITNMSVVILEASRIILIVHYVKISVLANMKNV